MRSNSSNSILVIVRQTPYGTSLARSSLEFALSAATFDQKVAVLFTGRGVLQLIPEQMSESIQTRNISKLISSFPLYDLDQLFVDQYALSTFGLEENAELTVAAQRLSTEQVRNLLDQYDHILGF